MRVTLQRESLLQPLLGLSKRNKQWIADRLYESIRKEESSASDKEKEMILKDIREGLQDVKEGRTFPADELFKRLDDDRD